MSDEPMAINATITVLSGGSVAYLVTNDKRLERIPSGSTIRIDSNQPCVFYGRIADAAKALKLDLRA